MKERKVIVNKSTVPVGTGGQVELIIRERLRMREKKIDFDVISNPEFLREGKAIYDFTHPDRIVIGTESQPAREAMKQVYNVLYLNKTPFMFCTRETAEMIKYASNSFLAVKISFINELAQLAEKVGADIQEIAAVLGMDGRISPKFLHAGPGFGGSCLPKDTTAIVALADKHRVDINVIRGALQTNMDLRKRLLEKIKTVLEGVKEKHITVLGLSFKPETDDTRDSPAIYLIESLAEQGASIAAFCPQGITETRRRLKSLDNQVNYFENEYDAATGADALVVMTEWNQFRGMDLQRLSKVMRRPILFDFRNIYYKNPIVKDLFHYQGFGVALRDNLELISCP